MHSTSNPHSRIKWGYWAFIGYLATGSTPLKAENSPFLLLANQVPKGMQEFVVDVVINNEKIPDVALILEDHNRHIFLNSETLSAWRVILPPKADYMIGGQAYYEIDHVQGAHYQFSESNLTLYLILPPSDFQQTKIAHSNFNPMKIRPIEPGMYMNYDVSLIRNELQSDNNVAATTEWGLFNQWGVGTADFLLQSSHQYPAISASNGETAEVNPNSLVRLETRWTLDKPEDMASWRFGDSITGTSIWSGAVRFGGIQYATDFDTQPNFITFPLPGFEGQAIVPTTVNFLINNQLQQSNQVNQGPFDIQGVPTITGAGNLVVQTKDLLGRQTTVVLPYYASPSLLKAGLSDFSYEIGAVRNNYGLESNDYGPPMAVGTWSHGLNDKLTGGWHAELLSNQQTVGLSSAYNLDNLGIVSLSSAGSHSDKGEGGLAQIGFQRQTVLTSIGGQIISTTPHFDQLGLDEDQLAPSLTAQAYASYAPPQIGTFNISYTVRDGRSEPSLGLITLSYMRSLPDRAYLMISGVKTVLGEGDNQIYLSLSWSPFDEHTLAATVGHDQQHSQDNSLTFSKNMPAGNGYGYRFYVAPGSNQQIEADYTLQTNHGDYSAMGSQVDGTHNLQLGATGAIVRFANDTFLSRSVDESFVVASLPGLAGVDVYSNHQKIATTDKAGNAFIPNTRPYQMNEISFDPTQLPLNTNVESTSINAYPYYRSGVLVTFPVQLIEVRHFTLVNSHNQPLPPGTRLTWNHLNQEDTVGYSGEVFISSPSQVLQGEAIDENNQAQCHFVVPLPQGNAPIHDLGTLRCT